MTRPEPAWDAAQVTQHGLIAAPLAVAGLARVGVPKAEVTLNYQSAFPRRETGVEFDHWPIRAGLADATFRLAGNAQFCPILLSNLSDASGVGGSDRGGSSVV
jgi:hypothetical protein